MVRGRKKKKFLRRAGETFSYQSYSGGMDFGGSMGGYFEFVCGTIKEPENQDGRGDGAGAAAGEADEGLLERNEVGAPAPAPGSIANLKGKGKMGKKGVVSGAAVGKRFRVKVPRFPFVGGEMTATDDVRDMFTY